MNSIHIKNSYKIWLPDAMEEIIFKLKGVSALIFAMSQIDDSTSVEGIDSACMIINAELQNCIKELGDL